MPPRRASGSRAQTGPIDGAASAPEPLGMPSENEKQHIVVYDPSDEYWEGALVSAVEAPRLRLQRIVTLPFDARLMAMNAHAGYHRRAWGSGWPIDGVVPRMHCPLGLYAVVSLANEVARFSTITWAARLVPSAKTLLDAVRGGTKLSGSIRLAPDGSQRGSFPAPIAAQGQADLLVTADKLGMPDVDDGWTVYGRGRMDPPGDCFVAFGLFGQIPGLRVAWAAVTSTLA